MTVRSKYVGGALVYYEDHAMRFLDAIGSRVTKRIEELADGRLNADTVDPTGWTTTVVEAGAGTTEFSPLDLDGGGGRITTAAADNDGGNYQGLGESFLLDLTNVVYFSADIRLDEALQTDLFVGLAVTDADILGGVTERIGFQKLDASADLTFMVEEGGVETLSAAVHTVVDATFFRVEFLFDGPGALGGANQLYGYIDGVPSAAIAALALTNLPNATELRASLQFLTGEAVAHTCDFRRRITAIQIG